MTFKANYPVSAEELEVSSRFCQDCGRALKGKAAYLELDQRVGRYHDLGDVPPGCSQGLFPFGLRCAARLVAEEKASRAKIS